VKKFFMLCVCALDHKKTGSQNWVVNRLNSSERSKQHATMTGRQRLFLLLSQAVSPATASDPAGGTT